MTGMNSVRRSSVALLASAILVAGCAEVSWGQTTALTVSGSPAAFTVTTAVAGSQPAAISNSVTTYFVKVKPVAGVKKITAQLDAPMPIGTSLTLTMAPPPGATSLGPVALDMTPRDIVISIAADNGSTHAMTYVLSATVAAGVLVSQNRVVTLTLATFP